MDKKYIKSKIKGREVVYFLTTEEDLNEIKSKSIFGDIFTLLFSLSMGGIISIVITERITLLSEEQIKIAQILNNVFIISSIIFGGFALYFYAASFKTIQRIKGSGEIKSFAAPESTTTTTTTTTEAIKAKSLEILEASYWTINVSKNITERIKEKIADGKLSITANNNIDGDPDPGTPKKMTIKYRNNGTVFMREYNENDKIELP